MLSRALATIYPDRCLACGAETTVAGAFCPDCWSEAHFTAGHLCDSCGAPILGDATDGAAICEACHRLPPPWRHGRAVGLYEGPLRRVVLGLKHGDRLDLVPHMAGWMARAGADLLSDASLLVPVPLHWRRLLWRRFNQSALLARAIARTTGAEVLPDLLVRRRATRPQKDMSPEQRFDNQRRAITLNPRRAAAARNRRIVLVDDVMTTGATLFAATEACRAGGARSVDVVIFARVARPE